MSTLDEASVEELEQALANLRQKRAVASAAERGVAYATECPPVGTWEVLTEGDCEGKTRRYLGTHEGHVADIAVLLAPQKERRLYFLAAAAPTVARGAKQVTLDICINDLRLGTHEEQSEFTAAWLNSSPADRYKASPVEYGQVMLRRQ